VIILKIDALCIINSQLIPQPLRLIRSLDWLSDLVPRIFEINHSWLDIVFLRISCLNLSATSFLFLSCTSLLSLSSSSRLTRTASRILALCFFSFSSRLYSFCSNSYSRFSLSFTKTSFSYCLSFCSSDKAFLAFYYSIWSSVKCYLRSSSLFLASFAILSSISASL